MRLSGALSLLLSLVSLVETATVTYNWNITWVSANPDGQYVRSVVGVNGAWPCPKIEGKVGDYVVLNVVNQLGNQTWGIHFHGINQIQTPEMDGPSGVTTCPVAPGSTIQYKFYLDEPGTFWYHSHDKAQYVDGFRGPLIVHDPKDPYRNQYDEEVIMSVSDWYHGQSLDLVRNMLIPDNNQYLPPFPDGIIVNEGENPSIRMAKGKTYRMRLICYSAMAAFMVHFESHDVQVIMSDATYIQNTTAEMIHIAPAQRYDFLIKMLDQEDRNYPFLVAMDFNIDFTNKTDAVVWPANITGYLMLDPNKPATAEDVVHDFRPVDDATFRPLDNTPILGPVTKTIVLNSTFCMFEGLPRSCFNRKPYIPQRVPALFSAASAGRYNADPSIYGQINPFIVNYGDVVQIVINNQDDGGHPFHLHGHQYQLVERARTGSGGWTGNTKQFNPVPPRRDTIIVNPSSYAVVRYVANNPGVYLFHCHIEWHVEMGLSATIIEAPERLRNLDIPSDHINACKMLGIPTTGNAGGNSKDFTDQTNFNTRFPDVYVGSMYTASTSRKNQSSAN